MEVDQLRTGETKINPSPVFVHTNIHVRQRIIQIHSFYKHNLLIYYAALITRGANNWYGILHVTHIIIYQLDWHTLDQIPMNHVDLLQSNHQYH